MNTEKMTLLLTGNHAAAYGAFLAKPKVIPIYPITPQTPIVEKLTEFNMQGDLDAEFITVESEHSCMASCISASLTGVRVFTATSSQGLLLMHELLHFASGARVPIVMINANRTVAAPWGFWPDQTDSLSQRDTGWIQFYTESPQEALDTVIQAYLTAETVGLPAMVIYEAFYVSHSLEAVEVPAQDTVDRFLPPYDPELKFDPETGRSWGNVVDQEMYSRHRKSIGQAMEEVFDIAGNADRKWKEYTGRGYGIIEKYKSDDAEMVIVTMGSISGTAKVAVDNMRAKGLSVGLLKIRLFRPFPVEMLRRELQNKSCVIVLDRNFSPGNGGILHQELKSALYGMKDAPPIFGYLAGVGGMNVSPVMIEELVKESSNKESVVNSIWVGDQI
jgi:pyruvate/2-oxoacid:ferredoxin oxidoreductase alpha subunit